MIGLLLASLNYAQKKGKLYECITVIIEYMETTKGSLGNRFRLRHCFHGAWTGRSDPSRYCTKAGRYRKPGYSAIYQLQHRYGLRHADYRRHLVASRHQANALAGVVIIAIFSALGGLSNDIWELVGLRGGWGLGNALFVATALSAIVTFSRSGTAQAIILYEAAIGLGISVGPLLGGELGTLSWRGPFIGVSVLMIIAFILILILLPAQANPSAHTHKVPQRISIADPIRALKHRPLFILGLTALLYNFGFFTLLAYAPLVLGKMGLQERGLGYVFLGWGILLAATSVIMAPKLQKRFGTLKSMYGMLFLFSLSLFAIGQWTDSITVVVGAVVLAGAFLGNNNTLITTAVMQAAPVERATASAAYSFLRFIGGAIAPWLAGKLAEWFNPSVPFFVGGSFVLFSVVFIWLCRNQLHHIDRGEAAH